MSNPIAQLDALVECLLKSGSPIDLALGATLDDAIDHYYYLRTYGNGTYADIAAARGRMLTAARAARAAHQHR